MTSNIEDRQRPLRLALSERETPFHWKFQNLPNEQYDGSPFNATTTKVDIPKEVVSERRQEVLDAVENPSETTDDTRNFWSRVVERLCHKHGSDEMLSFYDFSFGSDDSLLLRYQVLD